MPTTPTTISSILDLLSGRSATEKVSNIASDVVDKKLSEHEKLMNKSFSDLLKRVENIEKSQITDTSQVVTRNEDLIRSLIEDELGNHYLRMYVRRNSWQ